MSELYTFFVPSKLRRLLYSFPGLKETVSPDQICPNVVWLNRPRLGHVMHILAWLAFYKRNVLFVSHLLFWSPLIFPFLLFSPLVCLDSIQHSIPARASTPNPCDANWWFWVVKDQNILLKAKFSWVANLAVVVKKSNNENLTVSAPSRRKIILYLRQFDTHSGRVRYRKIGGGRALAHTWSTRKKRKG